jgi:hypothetical protein
MPPARKAVFDRAAIVTTAEKLAARGEIVSAIAEYSRLLALNPDDTATLSRVGDLYVRAGRANEAIQIFERLAKEYIQGASFFKALAIYKRINKLDPALLYIYEELGELYVQLELPDEAVSQLSVLADYYGKHGDPGNADRLRRRVAEVATAKLPKASSPQASDPVAELSIVGVPIVRTTSDMIVFLCHSSGDKPAVRALYRRLRSDRYQPWLDEEDLLPGQHWETEIEQAVRRSHVVLICLSNTSVNRAGFVQKEIKFALDVLAQQPEGVIFVVPARLEFCDVPPSLRHLHYVDLFAAAGYEKLTRSLNARAAQLGFQQAAG